MTDGGRATERSRPQAPAAPATGLSSQLNRTRRSRLVTSYFASRTACGRERGVDVRRTRVRPLGIAASIRAAATVRAATATLGSWSIQAEIPAPS